MDFPSETAPAQPHMPDFEALTTQVVTAYVANNTVAAADLPDLIGTVLTALAKVGQPPPAVEAQQES
jgi:predicted transcriptional regulator